MREWPLPGRYAGASGEVRWACLGEETAEPVVLLHGTPFSSYIWRDIAAALATRYRVYVWDMPGYGRSAGHAGPDLSLGALAATFAGLLGHWGLTEPLVVAHDSGAAVALGAHLLHGVPYGRLALADAVALAPWGSAFFEAAGAHPEAFARLPAEPHDALIRAYVGTASAAGLHPPTLEALTAPWLGDLGRAAFHRQLAQRTGDPAYVERLQGRYDRMDVPTLVCWGAEDRWISPERGRELAARIPGAGLRVLPGAGHLIQEDRPAELTAHLLAFLQEGDGS